jgi:hypothetical protein
MKNNITQAKQLNKVDFNFLMLVFLAVSFAGLWFLASKGVNTALIYTLMFLGSGVFLSLIFVWVKDDNTIGGLTQYFPIPLSKGLPMAIVAYLGLFAIPIIISLISVNVSASVADWNAPLMGTGDLGGQTFSAIETGQSIENKLFTIGVVAGTHETFAFNFVAVYISAIIALFIFQLMSKKDKVLGIEKGKFIKVVALLITTIAFIGIHLLNGSYQGINYVIAGGFILLMNIFVYYFRVPIEGVIGWHTGNNLTFLYYLEGAKVFFSGFLSLFGGLFIFFHALMIFYIVLRWDEVKKDFQNWANSF